MYVSAAPLALAGRYHWVFSCVTLLQTEPAGDLRLHFSGLVLELFHWLIARLSELVFVDVDCLVSDSAELDDIVLLELVSSELSFMSRVFQAPDH